MQGKLLEIINKYGVKNQLKHFNSEVFELNEAIIRYQDDIYYRANENMLFIGRKNVVEELADVLVMVSQFVEFYNVTEEELNKVMEFKINRQLDRIRRGE